MSPHIYQFRTNYSTTMIKRITSMHQRRSLRHHLLVFDEIADAVLAIVDSKRHHRSHSLLRVTEKLFPTTREIS